MIRGFLLSCMRLYRRDSIAGFRVCTPVCGAPGGTHDPWEGGIAWEFYNTRLRLVLCTHPVSRLGYSRVPRDLGVRRHSDTPAG